MMIISLLFRYLTFVFGAAIGYGIIYYFFLKERMDYIEKRIEVIKDICLDTYKSDKDYVEIKWDNVQKQFTHEINSRSSGLLNDINNLKKYVDTELKKKKDK